MITQKYKDMLGAKSVIRQMSEWAAGRAKEIGRENVFDGAARLQPVAGDSVGARGFCGIFE